MQRCATRDAQQNPSRSKDACLSTKVPKGDILSGLYATQNALDRLIIGADFGECAQADFGFFVE